ncbi:hypothetical protein LMG27174_03732 [Paraburkholderia rhynchosiae]|uniref:Uncharacterized protein n=1 Tax=Paraburkholderia rhynchosiae TaxID=487049 RepID=A0A6J5BDC2_9BURK|nr:hypothetical protein LMG27174_03732 [Paraburkholderia rhynchosiae]
MLICGIPFCVAMAPGMMCAPARAGSRAGYAGMTGRSMRKIQIDMGHRPEGRCV